MTNERSSSAKLEIAHVLLIDIVGYSKLLIDDQQAVVRGLSAVVRGSAEFQAADQAGKLVRLPTGDGIALIFFTTPEAPVRCALEIARAEPAARRRKLCRPDRARAGRACLPARGRRRAGGAFRHHPRRARDRARPCARQCASFCDRSAVADPDRSPRWRLARCRGQSALVDLSAIRFAARRAASASRCRRHRSHHRRRESAR